MSRRNKGYRQTGTVYKETERILDEIIIQLYYINL